MAGYPNPAFGARSKSEIDLLVFSCLIEAKAIDPDGPILRGLGSFEPFNPAEVAECAARLLTGNGR